VSAVPRSCLAVVIFTLVSAPGDSQDRHAAHRIPSVPQDILHRPIALRRGVGVAHEIVSTPSKEAQALYLQGLAFLHSYAWIDAARSFNAALRVDAAFAMALVGLSHAYEELNKPAAAREAVERARVLSAGSPDHDRRHIEIRFLQLTASVAAYRAALDEALAAFPSDGELWLLRGMAESGAPADRGQGSTEGSIRFYERALAIHPDYFPAHHYLVHAHENVGRMEDALEHAGHYVRLVPALPHAHHMHGHNLRRVGRIHEAIAEFRKAFEIETDRTRIAEVPPEHDWHHQHNLDLLATSHQYVGQMRTAERLLRRSFEIPSPLVVQEFNKHEWPAFLLARGRADEALAAARALTGSPAPIVRAIGHITAGRALLAQRQFAQAADASNAALKELRAAGPEASLPAPYLQALQAEFFLRTGERGKALHIFRDVRRKIRALPGPDAWSQGLYRLESIGRTAVATEAWELAAETAADMRAHDAAYGGTHYLAALVAEHKGDSEAELRHLQLADEAWRQADEDFTDVKDVRARLRRRKLAR
jgi:tetratricopeptide (TPR) repeat protein